MQKMLENLALGPACRLLLVLAPAGSQRAESLHGWLATGRAPVAWLSRDAGDNLPARFMARLVRDLERATGQALDGVGSDTIELLNALAGLELRPLVLVLENYDLIQAKPVHAIVQLMLGHPPPGLLLVLIAESPPPLEL